MPRNPGLYIVGVFHVLFSSLWFIFMVNPSTRVYTGSDELAIVAIPYLISLSYFLIIFFLHVHKFGWKDYSSKGDEHTYSLALVLFSLSAHCLNFEGVSVFAPYVNWMVVYVILMHISVLVFPFRTVISKDYQFVLAFINGAGLVLALYLCIFLGPLIVIALPASIFLGISMHATVPVWFSIYFFQSWKRQEETIMNKRSFIVGMIVPLLIFSAFIFQWGSIQKDIQEARQDFKAMGNNDLPEWAYVSSAIPSDPLIQKVLLAASRTQASFWNDNILNGLGGSTETVHDPLALAAMLFYGKIDINRDEMVKILETHYDARHMTHRRLWSGKELETKTVRDEIDIFPEYRLAYEQMTLSIHATTKSRWPRNQEAIYSFDLPDGAVATSLSLWVNGVEEKSRLTTKSKADSAYVQIVGRERRDPALMHWQEGNRVSVTVFPCTPDEDRLFKIGFTTPLQYENGRLLLDHVSFNGPDSRDAQSIVKVSFPSMDKLPEGLSLPKYWKIKEGLIQYEDLYQGDWTLSFDAPELNQKDGFIWNGHQYSVASLARKTTSWKADEYVLDINGNWSWQECRRIFNLIKDKEVYTYAPERKRLTEDNLQKAFEEMSKQSFSLLPMYKLPADQKILIVSSSDGFGPLYEDLDGTPFGKLTEERFLNHQLDVKWLNLSRKVAPYVNTLEELRLIDLEKGNAKKLETILSSGKFGGYDLPVGAEAIPSAHIQIIKTAIDSTNSSNRDNLSIDHLFRLHSYQGLMRNIGREYFDQKAIQEKWIQQAEEAYILSPVSSLIVLESQQDYERMGIEENENTVGNAQVQSNVPKNNAGAVPEPHEWVLIICMGLVLLVIGWKKWLQ
ncbi:MAG: XrtN system VIT domain-containing protein [Bacteroidota bacterium]